MPYNSIGQLITTDNILKNKAVKFKPSALIIPSILIAYGAVGVDNGGLKIWNSEIKEELNENIDKKVTIDDFAHHLPALNTYALGGALGVKGRNNFRDKTTIFSTSYLIMAIAVNSLKYTTDVMRPDGSSNNSFPSGHTATAFMGAELLHQEYKDVSPWYGIAGYLVAAGTGFFRMYNDRH